MEGLQTDTLSNLGFVFGINTNGRIPLPGVTQATPGNGTYQPGDRKSYESNDNEDWFLGFDEEGNDVFLKPCKVVIEDVATTDSVTAKGNDREENTFNFEVETINDQKVENQKAVRQLWSKEMNKLVMSCFYRSDPTKRGYRKRMIAIWREIGAFEINEQRLADQARVIRANQWFTELELEEIRRGIHTPMEREQEEVNEEINTARHFEEEQTPANSDTREVANDETDVFEICDSIPQEDRTIANELKEMVGKHKKDTFLPFKRVEQRKLRDAARRVNSVLEHIQTKNITQTNELALTAAWWVAKEVGLKEGKKEGSKKEPWWKRRIEKDIDCLRRDVNRLERQKQGKMGQKGKRKARELEKKYRVKQKGIEGVLEELKQRVNAKKIKVKRYEHRISQFRQNRLFHINQKQVYKELNGLAREEGSVPDSKESIKFWSNIWSVTKEHNKQAEWLQNCKRSWEDGES